MTNEKKRYILFKKIATRFLKETGLLEIWKEYLKHDEFFRKNCWYEKYYIEEIFGKTIFTGFIEKKINKRLPFSVYSIFITYCKLNGFDKYIKPNSLKIHKILHEEAILNTCFKIYGNIKYV